MPWAHNLESGGLLKSEASFFFIPLFLHGGREYPGEGGKKKKEECKRPSCCLVNQQSKK